MPDASRPEPAAPRRRRRRLGRAFLVLLLLIVALLAALHLPPVQTSLVGGLIGRLEGPIGLTVRYDALRFNLITRSVAISGLRLSAPGSTLPFVTAERVDVRFPFAAFRGRLDDLSVDLHNAHVALIREDDRWTTMPARWFEKREGGGRRRIPAFARLRLRSLDVAYEDRDARFAATLQGFDVDLTRLSATDEQLSGRLNAPASSDIRFGDRGTTITLRDGIVRFSPDGAGIDGLRLDGPEGEFRADVRFAFEGSPRLTVDAAGTVHGESLDRWADALDTASGSLEVRYRMPSRTPETAFADVEARSTRFVWRGLLFSPLEAAGALATGWIHLDRLSAAVAGGDVRGEGRLAWSEDEASRGTLQARDLDAGALFRTLAPDEKALLAQLAPGSRVSGRFDGEWTSWDAEALDGRFESAWAARPSGLVRGERWWFSGRLDGRLRNGRWALNLDQRLNDAIEIAGDLSIRASERAYGDWPMEGTLTLSGESARALAAGLAVAGTTSPVDLAEATGTMAADVSVRGTLGEPVAATNLTADIAWPDQPAASVTTRVIASPARVDVESFEGTSGPSRATASAVFDLDRSRLSGEFVGEDIAVSAWTRRFDAGSPADALVDIRGTLSGSPSAPVVDAQVEGGALLAGGQQIAEALSATVHWEDGTVTAEPLRLVRDGGEVTGRVAWTPEGREISAALDVNAVSFAFDVPGLAQPADGSPAALRAQVSGHVEVGGTLETPDVEMRLGSPAVTLADRELGAVEATITTDGSVATVAVHAPALGLSVDGPVRLDGARPFDLNVRLLTPDSPVAVAPAGLPIDVGALDIDGRVSGTLEEPSLERLDVRVRRLEALAGGLPVSAAPGGRLSWTPDHVEADGLELSVGEARAWIEGTLDNTSNASMLLRAEGRLEHLRPALLVAAGKQLEQAVFEGPFCIALTASGDTRTPRVRGSMDLDGVRVGDGRLPPLEALWVRVDLNRERLQLNLVEANWQGAHLALSGHVPTRMLRLPGALPGGVAEITGHVDEVSIDVLEPFVGTEALQATTFDARVNFTLRAAEPTLDALEADLELAQFVLKSRDLGLAQRRPARLHLANRALTLEPWTLGVPWSVSTQVTIAGAMTLADTPVLNATAAGRANLRPLSLLFGTYRPAGNATFDLRIGGPATTPQIDGRLALADVELLIRDPRLVLANVNGTIRFAGERMTVEGLRGTLNGGSIAVAGSMQQPGRGEPVGALQITARSVLLNEPAGLRSVVDADLQFRERRRQGFQLAGNVTVLQAAYRETLLVTGGLLSILRPSDTVLEPPRLGRDDDEPRALTFDVRVVADDSITIDTTFARLALGTNLRVRGSPEAPRLTGQAIVAPGGQLFIGGRTYQVETGVLEFNDPTSLRPDVRLMARTTVSGYDVTLEIDSRDGVTESTLRSEPPIPEQEIASLLLYGDRNASGAGAGELVTEQLAAALSGEIVGAVGRAIGIDSVRVGQDNPGDVLFDSSLISSESNPSQRISFSKRIFPDLEVVVSQSLRESGDITWIVSWQPIERFELRFVQLDNQDRSYEIRHDISFGGGTPRLTPRRRAIARERIAEVRVQVEGAVTEADARARLELDAGEIFDFYGWQEDRDRLQSWLMDLGFYEARVHAHRDPPSPPEPSDDTTPVTLVYEVATGPRTVLSVSGVALPDQMRDALAQAWADLPVDTLLPEEFAARLRPWLASEGYLRPTIDVEIRRPESMAKVALVTVQPGPRFTERSFEFSGQSGIERRTLVDTIRTAGLENRAWSSPELVAELLTDFYRGRGFLSAEVTVGQPRFESTRAVLPVEIREGPLFKVGAVRVVDESDTSADGVEPTPPIAPGAVLTDRAVATAVRDLRRRYIAAGYRGTRVRAQSTAREGGSPVDLVFRVERGPRLHLRELRVEGASTESESLVARQMTVAPGEPLSLPLLNTMRQRLYDTGLFRTVDVNPVFVRGDSAESLDTNDEEERQVDVVVSVQELPKYRLRYGFQLFDPVSEEVEPRWGDVDPGIVVDLTRRGLFGRAITAGVAARVNSTQQAIRAYMTTRNFFGVRAPTSVFIGDEREQTGPRDFELQYWARDFSVEQRARRGRLVQLYYGYNFRKLQYDFAVLLPGQPAPLPVTIRANISRLLGSVVFDQRNDVLDTTRGWFHSSSVEVAPEALGTTSRFTKYLGQLFYFHPIVPEHLVFGSAARVELAAGPGRSLIASERLATGGATTVRGYVDDSATLQSLTSATEGTTGISVFSQELRFPLFSRLAGAVFWDHASLFGDLEGFQGLRVRNSFGAGVRLILPFILVRVDYGYPLNQDEANDSGRWYFAIGQAF